MLDVCSLRQPWDRIGMVNPVRADGAVGPDRIVRNAQCFVDRRRQVFRRLLGVFRVAAMLVRRADDLASSNTTSREKHCLHGPPMVATGQLIELRQAKDLGGAAKFAGPDHQGLLEEPAGADGSDTPVVDAAEAVAADATEVPVATEVAADANASQPAAE